MSTSRWVGYPSAWKCSARRAGWVLPRPFTSTVPSATAEGYNILTLDELRPCMAQIEAKFLEIAGVQFDAQAAHGVLRVVTG